MCDINELQQKLRNSGQLHLLKFFDTLKDYEKEAFLKQLSNINFEDVNQLYKKAVANETPHVLKLHQIGPIPPSKLESEETTRQDRLDMYYKCGLEEISKGHVGVLLMAGGQGTRLGVNYPKGMYSIGLLSGKSLFQIQAERIRRVQDLAFDNTGSAGKITWYIMCSASTIKPTDNFLKENNYFGLDPTNVIIFQQGLLPCFNFDGKIILEDRCKISMAPDGNGGLYEALQEQRILDDMFGRGIKYIHAHSVDNVLVKVADPIFLGYCITKGADYSIKVVRKTDPTETLGVVCQVGGQIQVVEYSEIPDEIAKLRDSQGNLVFNAGNICNHLFTTDFLRSLFTEYEFELKLHVAKKKIPFLNDDGEKINPNVPNGIKIEKFVFDAFRFSENFVVWEVPRYKEFSALKNSDDVGQDCPSTARNDMFNLCKRYIEDAGGIVEGNEIEISPLLSYAGEDLNVIAEGNVFKSPTYLI